jgi:amidase
LLPDLARTTQVYAELLSAFHSADLSADELHRVQTAVGGLDASDASITAHRLRGLTISHPDWLRLGRVRAGLMLRWQALFRDVDVVLCPPMPTPAFPHDHAPQRERKLDVDGKLVSYVDQYAWISAATLCGLPATVAPIERSEAGLPIGVQIIGGYLEDHTTIGFAALLEREYGGFVAPPAW